MEYWILTWFLSGVLAAIIAALKGRGPVGYLLLGWIIGPLVPILLAVAGGSKCPRCARNIPAQATVCSFCGADIAAERRAKSENK